MDVEALVRQLVDQAFCPRLGIEALEEIGGPTSPPELPEYEVTW